MSSEIKWSEPMKPVAGDVRPPVYQFRCDGVHWEDWAMQGQVFHAGSHDVSHSAYRIPLAEPPAPSTIPYLPYIVMKCEQQLRESDRFNLISDGTLAKNVGLHEEMRAAIRECADRLTAALAKSKE